MADRLKTIVLLVVLCGAVAVGVAMIEVRPAFIRSGVEPSDDLNRMQREVAILATTIRRLTVADSVEALLAGSDAGVVLAYDSSPSVSGTVRSLLAGDAAAARVVLLSVRADSIGTRGAADIPPRADFIFKDDPTRPWCAAVHYRAPARRARDVDDVRVLGPCLFWARYGAPGPAIGSWLEKGAYRFTDAPASYVVHDPREARTRRAIFGLRRNWYDTAPAGERCLAGRSGACAEMALDTTSQRWRRGRAALPDAPAAYSRWDYGTTVLGDFDPAMLALLEQEFGREHFLKFWRSPEQVQPAFQAAFGVSLDEWVREWARARYGPEPVGPRLTWVTALLSVLTIGILLGIALRIVHRREVR